jgi:O-antigen/teichoic acid export membrane protein
MLKKLHLFINRLKDSVIGSAVWLGLSAATSRGVLLIGGFVISHSFGLDSFALFSFLIATVGIATVFSNFGLGLTITKIISDSKFRLVDIENFLGTSRIIAIILSTALSIVISFNLNNFAGNLISTNGMQSAYFVCFGVILHTLIALESSILIGFRRFKAIGIINLSTGIIQLTLIAIYSFHHDFTSVLISAILTAFLNYILMAYYSRKYLREAGIFPKARVNKHTFLLIRQYSLPLFLSSIFYAPTIWLASTVIINSPDGSSAIGFFYAADNLRSLLLFFAAMIAQASLPYLSEYSGEEHVDRFQNLVRQILLIVVGLTAIIVTAFFLLTPIILKMYGLESDAASSVMSLILISSVFAAINNVFGQVLLAKRNTWPGFIFNLIWSLSLILTTISLSFLNYTSVAMPMGFLISYIIITIIQYYFIKMTLGIKIFSRVTFK